MDSLSKDIRYAIRALLKRPGFTLVAVITLALGIGANTAIFTLINAVVLKSLPVAKPEELVLFNDASGEGTSIGDHLPVGRWRYFSYPSYEYFRDHNQSFQELAAFRSGESRISVRRTGEQSGSSTQRSQGHLVSGNYFSTLGVKPMLGRMLRTEDDRPEARPVAVMSYGQWAQQWNSDSSVVGKEVMLNDTAFTIVGVTPPDFFGERVRRSPDFWMPLAFQPQIELRDSYLKDENVYWLNFIGRLQPGVKIEQAQADVSVKLQQFLTERAGSQLTDELQNNIRKTYVQLAPGGRGLSGLRFAFSRPLSMLMAIVALVLLIACANVGNLLLSRATSRQPEMSLRLALGASRSRLVRQLLTESILLGTLGGFFGLLFAQWGVKVLVALVAKGSPLDVHPDALILGFTVAVSIVTGVLFGLVPALRASKPDIAAALKERTSVSAHRRFGLASALVVVQVGVSLVLLTGAGLFARSLMKLQEESVGFDRDNVLLVTIDPRLANYKPAELGALYQRLLERVGSLPGVRAATVALYAPMGGSTRSSDITILGHTRVPGEDLIVEDMLVGPGFCETLGVPVLQGRAITSRDTASAQKIAIVNDSFAQYFFPGQNPIGQRFHFGDEKEKDSEPIEILGVIGDMKFQSAKDITMRAVYRPILQVQDQSAYAGSLEIRTAGDPLQLAGSVRQAIAQVDEKLPISSVKSLREQLEGSLQEEQLIARLVGFFGLLALLLACVGLYGLMAHAVVRRTNEIGIRMALGAERRDIILMVLKETLLLVGLGVVVGVPMSLAAARLVANQLFGLTPSDPITLIGAATLLTVVAAIAGYVPARRASRVDPLVALRYE